METSPEIVAAAEAVRAWVHAQRAGWNAPMGAAALVATPPVAPVSVKPAPAPIPVAPAPAESPAVPVPTPSVSAPAPAVIDRPAPVAFEEGPASSDVVGAADGAPSVFSRGWVKAAAGIAAAAVVVGGLVAGRGAIARIAFAPKTGTAVLTSEPQGAEVLIDGASAGSTPLKLDLPVGKHAIEFKLNAATRSQTIEVAKGKETSVTIDWNAKPLGALRVDARPTPARVLVDGKERGTAPLTVSDLPVGAHTVQIETAEGSVRRRVEISQGRTETISEEIFPGWLHVSSSIEVTVVDGRQPVQLDDSNRVLMKPGVHTIRLENRALGIAETRQVTIEPGGTADVSLAPPESTLTVTGTAGAEVYVDGAKAGEIPLADFKVKLGPHDIMVVDKSGATRHASVTVTANPAQLDVSFGP